MNKLINQRISGYKVVCDFNNERVLAYNRNAPQQWVVWQVDSNREMHAGKYFSEAVEARIHFIKSVSETRLSRTEIEGIQNLNTRTLEDLLILRHKPNTTEYDVCSKDVYDFSDNPYHAWKAYLRMVKTITMKQIFEILNLEKMRSEKSIS